jgi:putative transposase
VSPDFILSLIDPDPDLARKNYSRLLRTSGDFEPDNVLEQETAIEKLVSKLADIFPWLFKKEVQKERDADNNDPKIIEQPQLEEMIRKVHSWKPRSAKTRQARKYLVEQLLARGFKKTEIAARLGISRKTVYNILNFREH